MYLPTVPSLAGFSEPTAASDAWLVHSNAAPSGGWSSLIGIITAICGNVLISFALNTQRYAHIRLSRDRDEWKEKQRVEKRSKRQNTAQTSYGTQESDIAEQRAKQNAKSEPHDHDGAAEYTMEPQEEANEADPLIPRLGSRKASTSSEDTVRPDEKDNGSPAQNSYLKSPIWWLGISLMVVGEAGNFLAYGFAPASIVSPLGVVALVSNCLIAPLLLLSLIHI